jgi:hypothetical protein
MRKLRTLLTVGVLVAGVTFAGSASAAEQSSLQDQIDEVLAKTEGGVQISANEIAWEGGQVIMSFPKPGETDAPISSRAAQRLQAKVAGKPADTTEPAALTASAEADDECPTEVFGNDWYCFYQYEDFGGRRLQWNATHKSPVYFDKYDFDNRTSSWSNKGGKTITVWDNFWVNNPKELWWEYAHSRDNYVGSALDNQADSFTTS